MHNQKSFACAITAAVIALIALSLAGQSAQAAPIIIDQEYLPSGTTTGTTSDEGANAVYVGDTGTLNPSYAFDSRQAFVQLGSGTATLSGTVTLGGNLTMSSAVSGAATGNTVLSTASWYNVLGGASNLLGNGVPVPNDTLVIDVDAISTSGPGSVTLKTFALDSSFNRIEYTLGLTSNLYEIPFNDGGWVFTSGSSFDWGNVLELGFDLTSSSPSTSNRSASVTIGTVSVVPEPSAYLLAIVGLAGGCLLRGRLKKSS